MDGESDFLTDTHLLLKKATNICQLAASKTPKLANLNQISAPSQILMLCPWVYPKTQLGRTQTSKALRNNHFSDFWRLRPLLWK